MKIGYTNAVNYIQLLVNRGLLIYGVDKITELCSDSGIKFNTQANITFITEDYQMILKNFMIYYSKVNVISKIAVQSLANEILPNSRESVGAYKVLYNKGGGRTEKKALQYEEEEVFLISDTNERLAEFLK